MAESKPLYVIIQEYILEQIRKGHWKPGDQIPPERELAEQFNVSRITAKSAIGELAQRGYVTRNRGRGTFVARGAAGASAMLSPNSKKLIGLIIPWIEFRYFSQLFSGVEEELNQRGYHLVVKRIAGRESESQAIQSFLQLPVDAIIVVTSPGEHFNEDIVRLVLDKFPVILVEKSMRDIRTNSVYCDAGQGGALMANYLLAQGARRIGLVTYPPEFTYGVKARMVGFQTALRAAGTPAPSEERTLIVPPEIMRHSYEPDIPPEMLSYLERHPDLEAIAAMDALLARLIGKACCRLGRTRMKIVCFDTPTSDPGTLPPAAYIDQSPVEVGKTAARFAVEALEGGGEPKTCVIEPRLVELLDGE